MPPTERGNGAKPHAEDGTAERVDLTKKPLNLSGPKQPSQAHWYILGLTLLAIWAGAAVVVVFTN